MWEIHIKRCEYYAQMATNGIGVFDNCFEITKHFLWHKIYCLCLSILVCWLQVAFVKYNLCEIVHKNMIKQMKTQVYIVLSVEKWFCIREHLAGEKLKVLVRASEDQAKVDTKLKWIQLTERRALRLHIASFDSVAFACILLDSMFKESLCTEWTSKCTYY